ncbi:MAG: TRAP transporter small permease [Chloroflexota bacterium]|nr:TRAP transporter small permease [Chloroflexota bacterium]
MNKFRHIIEFIANIGGYFSGWLVPLMVALITVEVFMRYVLHRPPMIADEFSAYILVAMSYLGAAYAFKEKSQVRITAFVIRLPQRVSSWLRVGTLSLALLFSIGLTWSSYDFMMASFKYQAKSATWLNFPLQGPQMTIPIGFALLALIQLAEVVKAIMDTRSGTYIKESIA